MDTGGTHSHGAQNLLQFMGPNVSVRSPLEDHSHQPIQLLLSTFICQAGLHVAGTKNSQTQSLASSHGLLGKTGFSHQRNLCSQWAHDAEPLLVPGHCLGSRDTQVSKRKSLPSGCQILVRETDNKHGNQ